MRTARSIWRPAVRIPSSTGWRWAAMDELEALIVPFKRQVYRAVIREFRHLAKAIPARARSLPPARASSIVTPAKRQNDE